MREPDEGCLTGRGEGRCLHEIFSIAQAQKWHLRRR